MVLGCSEYADAWPMGGSMDQSSWKKKVLSKSFASLIDEIVRDFGVSNVAGQRLIIIYHGLYLSPLTVIPCPTLYLILCPVTHSKTF